MSLAHNLTDQQQKFLDVYFETKGDAHAAEEAAGYSKGYSSRLIRTTLRKEVIEAAEGMLVSGAIAAANDLVKVINGTNEMPTNPIRLQYVKEILDRVGIVKKDKLEISGDKEAPLFILPSKNE